MYKISFYVPTSHVETVKNAMFEQGAGKIGDYKHCAWQTLGQGQFEALPGTAPFIGRQNQLEIVAEYQVEMVCADQYIHAVIDALKATHPYEEPAYAVWKIESF